MKVSLARQATQDLPGVRQSSRGLKRGRVQVLSVFGSSGGTAQEVIAKAVLGPFPYIGLIGSDRKWVRFKKRLEQRGFGATELARVHCPIGVSKHSKEPTAIAISTAAELLDVMQSTSAE